MQFFDVRDVGFRYTLDNGLERVMAAFSALDNNSNDRGRVLLASSLIADLLATYYYVCTFIIQYCSTDSTGNGAKATH
jgi:hypothetical protein